MLLRLTRLQRDLSRRQAVARGQRPRRLRGRDEGSAAGTVVARGAVGGDGDHAGASPGGTGERHIAVLPRFIRPQRDLSRRHAVARGQRPGGMRGHDDGNPAGAVVARGSVGGDGDHTGVSADRAGDHHIAVFPGFTGLHRDPSRRHAVARRQRPGRLRGRDEGRAAGAVVARGPVRSDGDHTGDTPAGGTDEHHIAVLPGFTGLQRELSRRHAVARGQRPGRLRGHDGGHAAGAVVGRGSVGGDGDDTGVAADGTGEHHVAVLPRLPRQHRDLSCRHAVAQRQGPGHLHGHDEGRAAGSGVARGAVGGDGDHTGASAGGTGEHHVAVLLGFTGLQRELSPRHAVARGQGQCGFRGVAVVRGCRRGAAATAAATAGGQGDGRSHGQYDCQGADFVLTHLRFLVLEPITR